MFGRFSAPSILRFALKPSEIVGERFGENLDGCITSEGGVM
jgi:hypothetical protein